MARSRQNGITLIELMIVVVIVGILAAIAYPSYRNQILRTTRTEARVALEQRALQLEKCFTRYMSYNTNSCPAGQPGANRNTDNGNYSITIDQPTSPTTFTLRATAIGAQRGDNACATLRINERGQRLPAGCW